MNIAKLMLTLGTVAVASAASRYNVDITESSMFAGKEIKPGSYKIEVDGGKAVLKSGKTSVEANVSVETAPQKYQTTSVRYATDSGKYRVQEIHVGGSTTKLVISDPSAKTATN